MNKREELSDTSPRPATATPRLQRHPPKRSCRSRVCGCLKAIGARTEGRPAGALSWRRLAAEPRFGLASLICACRPTLARSPVRSASRAANLRTPQAVAPPPATSTLQAPSLRTRTSPTGGDLPARCANRAEPATTSICHRPQMHFGPGTRSADHAWLCASSEHKRQYLTAVRRNRSAAGEPGRRVRGQPRPIWPASTGMAMPVRYCASSEARKRTTSLTSRGSSQSVGRTCIVRKTSVASA